MIYQHPLKVGHINNSDTAEQAVLNEVFIEKPFKNILSKI